MKEKTIKTTIILGEGEFEDGTNARVIEGLTTKVEITKNGLPEKNSAKIIIYNLPLADMEKLTFLSFIPLELKKNKILIEAGNKGEELSVVFKGDITASFADFSSAPDIALKIEAITAGWSIRATESPTSVDGEAKAADLIQQFASTAGFAFVNEGVTDSVRNSTFNGSPIDKAQAVADEIGAELLIDDDTITLQPYDKAKGDAVDLSADSGLIGYPSFNSQGIELSCFFDNRLKIGGQIKLTSIVPKASGYWKITKLGHSLSAYTQGDWRSKLSGVYIAQESEQSGEGEQDGE